MMSTSHESDHHQREGGLEMCLEMEIRPKIHSLNALHFPKRKHDFESAREKASIIFYLPGHMFTQLQHHCLANGAWPVGRRPGAAARCHHERRTLHVAQSPQRPSLRRRGAACWRSAGHRPRRVLRGGHLRRVRPFGRGV